MAATFGMGLSGCNDDNNSSNTGGNTGNATSPKGNIVGSVVDTNGNFVVGATVRIGSLSATTNAGGQYEFNNVAVGTAVTNSGNGASAANAALPISISGPTGYLSSSISVSVSSQVTCSPSTGVGTAGGDTNPQCVLIDGFNVGAGIAVLPRLNSTVTGTLRNKVTGLPIPNQVLTLDFRAVDRDQAQNPGILVVGYSGSGDILSTTTDASGNFTFTNTAADSCYTLQASNWDIGPTNNPSTCGVSPLPGGRDPSTLTFSTTNEGANTTNLASVLATVVSNQDLTKPFVTGVVGVPDGTTNPGALASGVNTTFNIDFSEPVLGNLAAGTALDVNDVIVTSGSTANPVFIPSTATVVDANTISVVIATPPAPLAAGLEFKIDLRNDRFVDGSGNVLTVNTQDSAPNQQGGNGSNGSGGSSSADPANVVPPVNYDSALTATGQTRLSLRVFKPLDTNTNGATVTPVVTPVNPASDNFFNATAALADFIDGNTPRPSALNFADQFNRTNISLPVGKIEQLNAVFPVSAAQQHPLLALFNVLDNRKFDGSVPPNQLDVNAAAADITFGTADHYVAWVEDRQGNVLRNVLVNVSSNDPINGTDNPRVVGVLDQFAPVAGKPAVPKSFESATTALGTDCTDGVTGTACPLFVISKGNATSAKIFIRDSAVVLDNTTGTGVLVADYNPTGEIPDPVAPATLVPGATLHVIARTANGFTGNEVVVPLTDRAAPTAGAQFYAAFFGAQSSANAGTVGSGGTVITGVSATGQVIFPVTPQALDLTDTNNGSATGLSGDTLRDTSEIQALSRAALTGSALDPTTPNFIADATGTAAFLATPARRLGLTVTEPIVVGTGTPTLSAGFTAPVTPVSTVAINADTGGVDELGNAISVLPFDTNFRLLEADGRAKRTIDFSPVFTDKAATPNQASKAIVQVRDFLPPIMTKGFFDGSQFVFRFSEPVSATGDGGAGAEITIACGGGGADINIDFDAVANNAANSQVTIDQGGLRVRVPMSVVVNGVSQANAALSGTSLVGVGSNCFSTASNLAYAEPGQLDFATLSADGDTALSQVATAPAHGAVRYNGVRDTADNTDIGDTSRGNTWAKWSANNLGVSAGTGPVFAFANVVPPFVVTSIVPVNFVVPTAPAPAPGNAGTQVTFTVTFSGPVFLADTTPGAAVPNDINGADADEAGNNNGVVDTLELTNYFNSKFEIVNSAGNPLAVPPVLDSATMSRVQNGVPVNTFGNDGNVLTLVYTLGQNLVSGDRMRLRGGACTIPAPSLVAGETASCAISGAVDPVAQFVLRDDGNAPATAREVAPRLVP